MSEMKDLNIGILKCKEKDLKHNLTVMCEKKVELIRNVPSVIGKGRYFYITCLNQKDVENLSLKGTFL